MLSQQDQEMRRNVPDPSFAGVSHFCGSGAGNETRLGEAVPSIIIILRNRDWNHCSIENSCYMSDEPVASLALPSQHFQFRKTRFVVRLPLQTACVPYHDRKSSVSMGLLYN